MSTLDEDNIQENNSNFDFYEIGLWENFIFLYKHYLYVLNICLEHVLL